MREPVDQDELDYDTKRGNFKPVESLFDGLDPVEELEPEPIPKGGTWRKVGSTEFYVRND